MAWVALIVALLAFLLAWWAWAVAEDNNDKLEALRYTLRRELGSDRL